MAGRITDDIGAAITAATATGYITVGSVVGFYRGCHVYLSAAGQPSRESLITEVLTGTNQLGIRFLRDGLTNTGTLNKGDTPTQHPHYGRDDVSAYNGGRVDRPSQIAYNVNDAPLT